MLSDFLHTLIDFFSFLWPFHIVKQWEMGLYLIFGRAWRVVGPGLYPKVPWFCELHSINVAWEIAGSSRNDITTKDGHALSFEATTMFRVVDIMKASVVVHDYDHAMQNIMSSVLAENIEQRRQWCKVAWAGGIVAVMSRLDLELFVGTACARDQ